MKVFNGIIGVLSVFGAIYCILYDGTSFLNYGWVVTLVLLLFGICSIVTYAIDKKEYRKKDTGLAANGIISLVFGTAGCVVSLISLVNIGVQAAFLLLISAIFIIYMLAAGIRLIVLSAKSEKSEHANRRVFMSATGIVLILAGAGGVLSWLLLKALSGITLGVMLGIFGCALIASLFRNDGDDSTTYEL